MDEQLGLLHSQQKQVWLQQELLSYGPSSERMNNMLGDGSIVSVICRMYQDVTKQNKRPNEQEIPI